MTFLPKHSHDYRQKANQFRVVSRERPRLRHRALPVWPTTRRREIMASGEEYLLASERERGT